jgi:predicted DNA-binding transcriptional regulator AlpA
LSDELLTASDLSDWFGVSAATILDRYQRGEIPGFPLWGRKGGPVRFRRSEVEALIESWHRTEMDKTFSPSHAETAVLTPS